MISTPAANEPRATDDGGARTFAGVGEMASLMRAFDWSRTSLGSVATWPRSLRTVVDLCLSSRYPISVFWGPELIQFYNDAYRPILGASKHPHALGCPARVTWPEIWDTMLGPMFGDVMRAGVSHAGDDTLFLLDRNGYVEETYFNFSYDPIRDDSGRVGGVFVACQETTERVLGERRLQTLRDVGKIATSARTEDEACALVGRALGRNPVDVPFAALHLFDARDARPRLAAHVGVDASSVEDDVAPWTAAMGDVADTGRIAVVSLPAGFGPTALPHDVPRPGEAVLLPLARPGQSGCAGVLVVGRNARRALDDRYREFLGLLANNIVSTIATARAYQDARERAEALAEIDRAKTVFLGNVSHEFRTPLTLLLGPAEEALRRPDLPPRDREQWQIVSRNGRRLARLVNALLDFARIEAGRIEASYEPTDLAAYTADLASSFRSAIESAGLRFTVDLPTLSAPVYVDREMWEKIVLNLLSNALKFTLEGEIAIALTEQGDRIELRVRDTGVGVAPEEVPRLFERFHRVRDARARTHEGSGIGLSLVQELVNLHGGRVGVESVVDRGSTFTVSIPKGAAHLPKERIGAPRTALSTATSALPFVEEALRWSSGAISEEIVEGSPRELLPTTEAEPARVLVVDDNADMRQYLARLLRGRWRVDVATDGASALEQARAHAPDLVLADVMMPGLDGFGLLRALRSDPATATIPVILLSARAGEEATSEGFVSGANDYLTKPFSARELVVRVGAQLAIARARREADDARSEVEKLARRVAESERARLYDLFVQTPAPICIVRGPTLVIELANRRCLDAWGKDESVIGKPILDALPELRGQGFDELLRRVLRTGEAYVGNEVLAKLDRNQDGVLEDAYFNFVYAPHREADGTVTGVLVCASEVTAQVLARRELEHALAQAARLNVELQEAQQLFRAAIENLPELAWSALPDGRFDFYNARWYEYTGTTAEQMLGSGWRSVQDPALLAEVDTRWRRCLDTGEPFEHEFPLRGADGAYRWFLTRAVPLRDAEGRILRWFGTSTKIDEQRRTRQAAAVLAEVSAVLGAPLDDDTTLQTLVRAAVPQFADFCILDVLEPGGSLRHAAVASSSGDAEEAIDELRRCYSLTPGSGQPGAVALNTEGPVAMRFPDEDALRATCRDDAHFALMKRIAPKAAIACALRVRGRVVGALTFGFTRDCIDESAAMLAQELARRAAMFLENARLFRSAKAAEAQKSAILDAALDSVVVMNDAGAIVDFNPAAERTFGRRRADVVGREVAGVLIPAPMRDAHREGLARYVRTGNGPMVGRRVEVTAIRADGNEFPAELAITPIRIGDTMLFTAYLRDISERRRAEAERARLLASEKAAREEAERSSRAKDEFLAIVSHELRNPLNAMLGWTRILRNGSLPEAKRERALETIERNAVNQSQLIEDLLDVSRIISGKLRLDLDTVDVGKVVEAAIDSVRPAIDAKQIRLTSAIASDAVLTADGTRIQQVVWNLLTNATKFTPAHGAIHVTLERGGSQLVLTVEDTGRGIGADFLPYVFERFRQADASTTRSSGGLGLGLSISKHLVEMHGGTIEARSEGEGRGSAFVIRLPVALLRKSAPRSSARARAIDPVTFECPSELADLHVLVVEDEEDARELVAEVLRQCGAVVTLAESAAEAFVAIERRKPDVLLSDIGMPGEDGYSFIRRLRALPREVGGDVPAASLTAYAGAEDRRRALMAGFNMHVPKPVEPAELVAVVANLARIARAIR